MSYFYNINYILEDEGCVLNLKYYFKNELKRALFGKGTIISFSITLGIFIAAFMKEFGFESIRYISQYPTFDAIDALLIVMSSTIVIVFPLLATIIFSDSYLQEKESGFTKFIYTRMPLKKYVSIKVIVNSISSALVAGASSLFMLIFLVVSVGIRNPQIASYTNNINGPLSYLLDSRDTRLIYALIIILLFSIAYMVTATLALGISAWVKNRYLVLITPFFYYILCGTIVERLGINRIFDFHLARVISLNRSMTTLPNVVIYPLLIFIVGVALFYIGVVIKNEKDL